MASGTAGKELRLTESQAQLVFVETGEEMDELEYPDPGGALSEQIPRMSEEDVGWLALAAAKVRAAERVRRRAEEAALEEAKAREEAASANAEELARIREEHERGQEVAKAAAAEFAAGGKKKKAKKKRKRRAEPAPEDE